MRVFEKASRLLKYDSKEFFVHIIGERARHSQVCSIENRGYIIYYGTCKFCSYNP